MVKSIPFNNDRATFAHTNWKGVIIGTNNSVGSDEDDSMVKYSDLHKEMSVLDKNLLEEGDDMVQSRMRRVLELLGVKSLQPMDVIKHHILPQFKYHYKVSYSIHRDQNASYVIGGIVFRKRRHLSCASTFSISRKAYHSEAQEFQRRK